MSDDRSLVRHVAWRDLLPWLLIFRTFGLSISVALLALATLGVLLMPLGWWCAQLLFIPEEQWQADPAFQVVALYHNHWLLQRGSEPIVSPSTAVPALQWTYGAPEHYFGNLVRVDMTWHKFAYFVLGGFWTLLVWAFVGAAITRIAVVQLGREERLSLKEGVSHAVGNFGSYLLAPLSPLLLSALIGLLIFLFFGLPMRLDVGVLLAGLLWVLALLGGFMMTVLLLGLLTGWPLMWVTISTEERGDAFEAWSRSYSYVFQRPLHYLFYALLALIFWLVSWALVYFFSESVIWLSYAAARAGMGSEQAAELELARIGAEDRVSGLVWFGGHLMMLWTGFIRTIAAAFNYSFFFCIASAIYLLLRHDADQTELDEVFLPEEEDRYGLPQVVRDHLK